MPVKELKPVNAQPGRPLYLTVRDAVRDAIDAGVFQPGEQMPSTKELSDQLAVSLVTTHRALQELVSSGILQRSQGKGTFVHERYYGRKRALPECRLGLVFHSESSLADYYHSQILEGVRQSAQSLAVDLVQFPFVEQFRIDGFAVILPCDDKARLLAVAQMLDVAQDQNPALIEIIIQLAARTDFARQAGIFNAHILLPFAGILQFFYFSFG